MSSFSNRDRGTISDTARRERAWRLILGTGADLTEAATGARNMAVDHALLESVQAGARPVLRLYRWDPPCLSLGRNQHAVGLYDVTRAGAQGIDIVRRPTGGLAVLHDQELTYCVLAPLPLLGGARAAYDAINRALVQALRDLGAPAERAAGSAPRNPRRAAAEPCFQQPAAGEVIAQGRKLVGSAQRCENGALLQHGSILLDGSQATVTRLLAVGTGASDGGSVTLHQLLGTVPPIDEVARAVRAGFEATFGIRLAPEALTCREQARARELEARYAADEWTWRR